jgi:hypothetical protein
MRALLIRIGGTLVRALFAVINWWQGYTFIPMRGGR